MPKKFTYNRDPEFWYSEHPEYNCGGFAFNIKEWYSPEWIVEQKAPNIQVYADRLWESDENLSEFDVADILVKQLTDAVLQDFDGEIRLYEEDYRLAENEELVAMRAAFNYWEDGWNESTVDFHFKVLRDGHWLQKCGWSDVEECDEEDWCLESATYNSETVYFAHKIAA